MIIDFFLSLFGAGWFAGSAAKSKLDKRAAQISYENFKRESDAAWRKAERTYAMNSEQKKELPPPSFESVWEEIDREFGDKMIPGLRKLRLSNSNAFGSCYEAIEALHYSHYGKYDIRYCGGNVFGFSADGYGSRATIPDTGISVCEFKSRVIRMAERNIRKKHPDFKLIYEENKDLPGRGRFVIKDFCLNPR